MLRDLCETCVHNKGLFAVWCEESNSGVMGIADNSGIVTDCITYESNDQEDCNYDD